MINTKMKLSFQETGIGAGQNFILKKHYGFLNALLSCLPDFIKGCLRCFLYFFINDRKKLKIYICRVSGFYNSLLTKDPGIDQD